MKDSNTLPDSGGPGAPCPGYEPGAERSHAHVPILGINAKLPAAFPNALKPLSLDSLALARLERFELQSVARRFLTGERVCDCLRVLIPGAAAVPVYFVPSTRSASFGQLVTCASVWMCPVCAAKISERRRAELDAAIATWKGRGGVVALLTLTCAHGAADTLWQLLPAFLDALSSVLQNRPFRRLRECYALVHMVRALEITWGSANGWHPHVHILLFLDRVPAVDAFRSDLLAVWRPALQRFGLTCDSRHGIDLQITTDSVADYVAKFGRPPARRPWGAPDELAKAHIKRASGARFTPFDLLRWLADTGEAVAGELFAEYAAIFKGRHQLQWSRGARAALGLQLEKSDEEIADEIEQDGLILALLSVEDWRLVRRFNQQGPLLEVARLNDVVSLQSFLAALRQGVTYAV